MDIKPIPLNILNQKKIPSPLPLICHLLPLSFSFSFSTSISVNYSSPQLENTTNMKVCMCNNSKKFDLKKIKKIELWPGPGPQGTA